MVLAEAMRNRLHDGTVIPAHPLALGPDRRLDEPKQRALTRYYLDSGAGGIAVGVHTTQFAIREPRHGLLAPVLALAAEEAAAHPSDPILVAGALGPTARATAEARTAAGLGYHAALVGMSGWGDAPEEEILAGVAAVGDILPIFGFYLQPAVGGRRFGYPFWRRFVDLPNVVAIKIAPFDRYGTLDVVRAVADAGRAADIALYTGNDDTIVTDLLTPYRFGDQELSIVGGLLGQWAVWTRAAVKIHRQAREIARTRAPVPPDLLALGAALTDANGALFDAANGFAGCIAGVNEILAREHRMSGNWCLDDTERLSPGQAAELDRVLAAYPFLLDQP